MCREPVTSPSVGCTTFSAPIRRDFLITLRKDKGCGKGVVVRQAMMRPGGECDDSLGRQAGRRPAL